MHSVYNSFISFISWNEDSEMNENAWRNSNHYALHAHSCLVIGLTHFACASLLGKSNFTSLEFLRSSVLLLFLIDNTFDWIIQQSDQHSNPLSQYVRMKGTCKTLSATIPNGAPFHSHFNTSNTAIIIPYDLKCKRKTQQQQKWAVIKILFNYSFIHYQLNKHLFQWITTICRCFHLHKGHRVNTTLFIEAL